MRKLNQTFGNVAYGAFSDSNNYATETNNFGETAFGILNKSTIDPDNFTSRDVVKSSKATLFSIGNGTEEERKNVIEIKGNGDVYINGVAGYTGTDTDQAGNIAEEFQGVHDSLDSIHMQKDDDSDLVYTLMVDGEERGTINIPKDQFLEDVNYDPDTKELVFIFVTSNEDNKEVRINIGNLVDVYSAGNGLSLTEGQFAIKLDPSTESYITVGADGLKVSGLDTKFDTLTQKDTEQDGRIQTAETDIDALQDITGSNTYTGANYISKETNLTDAVIQLDEEIKATNDNLALEHANAEATYSKLITTPFAGAKTYDAEHPTLTDWLPSQRSFIGTFKEAGPDSNWTNVISSRHKNGDDDGSTYGMYIANKLLGDGVGTLRWDQQVAGVWQGEKVILDSSNYTDYITNVDVSSSPLTGYQTSTASNEELFISDTDTVVQAIGKLEKAILDDEYVTSETFKMLNKYIGLPEQLTGNGPSDGTLVSKVDNMIIWESLD